MRIPVSRFIITLVSTALTLEACGGGQPPQETPTPGTAKPATATPGLQGPYGIYVTNEVSGDLTVIDPQHTPAIATLPLGKRPRGIRASPDRAQLYIALSGSPIRRRVLTDRNSFRRTARPTASALWIQS